jgi:DNA-binding CsgD family transcriptional regulator
MRNGVISDQARVLAAVSELDASPVPPTEAAAGRLIAVADALVRCDLSIVCLGEGTHGITGGQDQLVWRPLLEVPMWSSSMRGLEHPMVALHPSTGLFITRRRSEVGSRPPRSPAIDISRFLPLPLGYENMVAAPVDFYEHSYLASYRAGRDFSDGDIGLLDQLRPVGSRLLRRAAVSDLAKASGRVWGMAPREAEVFAFAGVGLSLPSIASILGLSVGTVRTHLGKAYKKSAVRSRAAVTSALLDVEPSALHEAGKRLLPGDSGSLTRREVAVLRIAATGRTTSAIASVIGVSTETAKTHLANVYRKLGVQNRSQALLLAGAATVAVGGWERTVEGT